jgi:hypothetical protein
MSPKSISTARRRSSGLRLAEAGVQSPDFIYREEIERGVL